MQSSNTNLAKIGFSIKEACQVSSLSRTTIYENIKIGKLRAVRVGGRTVIPAESLYSLINGGA